MRPEFLIIPCTLSPEQYRDIRNAYYAPLLPFPPPTSGTYSLPAERIAYAEYKVWDKNTRDLDGKIERFI